MRIPQGCELGCTQRGRMLKTSTTRSRTSEGGGDLPPTCWRRRGSWQTWWRAFTTGGRCMGECSTGSITKRRWLEAGRTAELPRPGGDCVGVPPEIEVHPFQTGVPLILGEADTGGGGALVDLDGAGGLRGERVLSPGAGVSGLPKCCGPALRPFHSKMRNQGQLHDSRPLRPLHKRAATGCFCRAFGRGGRRKILNSPRFYKTFRRPRP